MSEEQEHFSPFISILMIEYLKNKYENEKQSDIGVHLEFILSDIESNIDLHGGGLTSMLGRALKIDPDAIRGFGGKTKEDIEAKQKADMDHYKSVKSDVALARNPSARSSDIPSDRPSDRPAGDFLERCDNAIKKLEKHCDGEDVMKIIQKMLELINTRLNNK
jgi:hypothetical protein